MKWKRSATLYWPDYAPQTGPPLEGTLAQLIKLSQEALTKRERRFVHIRFDDTILGNEAITHAYGSPYFPLERKIGGSLD